ncbi:MULTISPECIES: hypothetical protein [Streptomyces]|uniref:Secreted protein n=1 Tax=Streptomyces gilvifuscus TaxID=1550617 RepID=A0ABT5G9Y5_9ACTN|nr:MULTISPECIES: hypothetical protein [Streptomyces]MBK3643093.1 hypothetical protein [Streptomyces sp. MBT33]MDC2961362.1 hypothetical protein [Streptomyces gilvifuscus]
MTRLFRMQLIRLCAATAALVAVSLLGHPEHTDTGRREQVTYQAECETIPAARCDDTSWGG